MDVTLPLNWNELLKVHEVVPLPQIQVGRYQIRESCKSFFHLNVLKHILDCLLGSKKQNLLVLLIVVKKLSIFVVEKHLSVDIALLHMLLIVFYLFGCFKNLDVVRVNDLLKCSSNLFGFRRLQSEKILR